MCCPIPSGNALIYTTDSQAVDKGGQLDLGGIYTGTSITGFGSIAGRKENGTDANLNGYLQFGTSLAGTIAEKMRITSTGNVGIRDDGAKKSLELLTTASANGPYLTLTNQPSVSSAAYSTGIDFRSNVSGTNSTSYSSGRIYSIIDASGFGNTRITFANATAENTFSDTMTLKAGNIGIGTTGPDAQLELSKSAAGALGPVLKLRNTGDLASDQMAIDFATGAATNDAEIRGRILGIIESGGGGRLDFLTGSGGALTTGMSIKSGNVGIGTTGPSQNLRYLAVLSRQERHTYLIRIIPSEQ